MDWHALGHAMWLVETQGLRLVFDPLLRDMHHDGTFDVCPKRTIRAEDLRPDFILVSHAHPDHFDVHSLRQLALADPDSVVVTPDELVAWTATKVGFRSVHRLSSGQRIALDGVDLVTTPSTEPDEWGAVIRSSQGVVFNQVDTLAANAHQMRAWIKAACEALEADQVDLAMCAWQPLNEVSAALGSGIELSVSRYDDVLRQVAATGASAVVPTASGVRHRQSFEWLNAHVYPLSQERFLSDLHATAPDVRGLKFQVGNIYRLRSGRVEVDIGASALVDSIEDDKEPSFRPLSVPSLLDPKPSTPGMRQRAERWVKDDLFPALSSAYADTALSFLLSITHSGGVDEYTIDLASGSVERYRTVEWDAWNATTLSGLLDVLDGHLHWGDLLLRGDLRAFTRAYSVDPEQGLQPLAVAETFVYHALSYQRSLRRQVERLVAL